MALEPEEITAAMEHPNEVYWSHKYEARMYKRGRISLSVRTDDDGTQTVVTILWSSPDLWDEDATIAPLADGREHRPGYDWRFR